MQSSPSAISAAAPPGDRPLRIVVCWTGISGYLAACWRALAALPAVDLRIISVIEGAANNAPFHEATLRGLQFQELDRSRWADREHVAGLVCPHSPDVVFLCGWNYPAFVALPSHPALRGTRFCMSMDTPLRNTFRQKLARFKIGSYLDRLDAVIVAGERSWQFARTLLKVPERKLYRGCYGIDYDAFAPSLAARLAEPSGWPRRFLFMGRYIEIKGIDVLIEAYRRYRAAVADPWTLTCHGMGALANRVVGEGVTDAGFVQPLDQPAVMARHGAFILPSLYEPWGVAIAEASAAGLPVIASNACGAAVDLVRDYFNGLTVATNDVDSLARAMRWIHERHAALPEMGRRAQHLAEGFSAQTWAERVYQMSVRIRAGA